MTPLNQREKVIALSLGGVLLVVLGGLAVNYFWIGTRNSLISRIASEQKKYKIESASLEDHRTVGMEWEKLRSEGMSDDPTAELNAAESLVQQLASRSGVSVTEQRVTKAVVVRDAKVDTDFTEYQFVMQASGRSAGIGQFLLAIENQKFPIKIEDVMMRAKKPGTNDLGIQLNVGTLVYTPKKVVATRPGRGPRPTPKTPEEIEKILADRRAAEEKAAASQAATQSSTQPAIMPPEGTQQPGFQPGFPTTGPSAAGSTTGPATAPDVAAEETMARMAAERAQENKQVGSATAPAVPAETPEQAMARMIAERAAENKAAGAATAPATQPTTQPTGGVQ